MNTLSGHAREAAAHARLQRSRRQAGGLLLAAVLLFIVSALFLQRHPALGYLKAFAEAATVGALADWFAVTALFRHPLGLKIPHTAILPRNQNRIADELGRFIETNFLPERPIAIRIYRLRIAEKLRRWLARSSTRQEWLPALARQIPAALQTIPPPEAARLGAAFLTTHGSGKQLGTALSQALLLLDQQGLPENLQTALLGQIRHWIKQPDTRVLLGENLRAWAEKIETSQPDTWDKLKAKLRGRLVGQIDSWVAQKALDWADNYLEAALTSPQHELRTAFRRQYRTLAQELATSEAWQRKLALAKRRLADSPELQQQIAQLWQNLTTRLAADAQRPDSAAARRLNSLLTYLLQQHAATPQQLRRLNVRLALLARSLVRRHRHAAAKFIADKVKSWDSRQMSDKLELSIGRDLQFIRINGTLVGGLVGLLIYTLSQWLPAL
ncbi:twitching motility protein PilT [Eikenella sp. NML03-A-027]|uniref:DUF445 domain-containing protein n=1 Tax=Eikenella sp. NML03-A-027 TaxID=1795828 RepID=UPI0007DFBCB3|nr:DUF445 domain-containing protein [Eikenella sp. NML03-A-027]OAM30542.1 twitching motility protein PilT [Eikenella sp. NML03-A-027]